MGYVVVKKLASRYYIGKPMQIKTALRLKYFLSSLLTEQITSTHVVQTGAALFCA